MDERPANVVEELVRDGIAPQRERGVIPRVNEVKKYVAGIVERLERKNEDQRLRLKPTLTPSAPKVRSDAEMATEYEKRIKRAGQEPLAGDWVTTRDAAPKLRTLRRTTQVKLLQARLRLLRSKPDWSAKVRELVPAMNGLLGAEEQGRAEFQFRELMRASDATFGPWLKMPARRVWFTR